MSLRVGAVILACLLQGGPAHGFPPAPHHTVLGLVRDELGQPLTLASANVILETPDGVKLQCFVAAELGSDVNYRLEVPMDSGITEASYQPTALRPYFRFKLKVRIGSAVYLPIEMKGDFSRIGQPAEETRMDLTLGEDSDGDGLPDAWERAMLGSRGGNLADVTPGGDFDGDRISNRDEYLAGTYASDPADGFSLSLVETGEGRSVLEFLAVRGRTYSVEVSEDLLTWTPAPFRLTSANAAAPIQQSYHADDIRHVRIELLSATGGSNRYFRALVR
jgi:hypothetical protein